MQDKMEEFKLAFSRYQESLVDDTNIKSDKEGEDMHEKLQELLVKYSLTDEVEQVKALALEDYSTEDELDAKLAEIAQEVSATNHSTACVKCGQEQCACDEVVEETPVVEDFAIEIQSLKDQLAQEKDALATLQTAFEALKSEKDGELQTLTAEVEELRLFKATKLTDERQAEEDALYESFATQLTAEEIATVKEGASSMSLEEVEVKLFALVGKKNFTATKEDKKSVVKVSFNQESNEDVSGYGYILTKHIKN
jgi:hypothetical protein